MKHMTLVATIVMFLIAPAVWAHDGHAHKIMGTVTARGDKDVKVRTPGGEVLSIAVTPATTVRRDKRKAAITDVQVGRRVVVDIGNGEDPLVARDIQVGVFDAGIK